MEMLILVSLVQVDILKTIVLVGMLVQGTLHTAIIKDGLRAMIWDTLTEKLIQGQPVRQVIAWHIVTAT